LTLEELAHDVVGVAGHRVQYDERRDLWFCDLRVNLGAAYHPWIRLALVRYQPGSIPGVELSRVVLADFAALPMQRSLLVTYDAYQPDRLSVTVSGIGYEAVADQVGTATPSGSLVDVALERRVHAIDDADLGWTPTTDIAPVADTDFRQDDLLWHGHIELPNGRQPGDYRLVIREYETLLADPTPATPGVPTPTQRLVFADTFDV